MELDLERVFKSKAYRMANLYSIVNKQSQRVPFVFNPIQRAVHDDPAPRKMILKSRQVGISTERIIDFFDDTIWNENMTTCILAHEDDALEKLFRIVSRTYWFLPDDLKPVLAKGGGSKTEMFFPEINSRIYVDLESRSDTISRLHVSEAAFIKDKNKLSATLQAVPITGKVNIETTPNGLNEFYDAWNDTDSVYKKLFFPWYLMPEYQLPAYDLERTPEEEKFAAFAFKNYGIIITDNQLQFRRFKRSEIKGLFIQEYPEDPQSCFLASGESPVDLIKLKAIQNKAPKPIEETETTRIFERKQSGARYVIGADTSEGIGGDFSTATILNIKTLKQVAALRGQFKPSEFADALNNLASEYSHGEIWPVLAVERNNHGHTVLSKLDETHYYPNLYRHKDERLGWLTDKVSRPIMLDTLIEGVENETCQIFDKITLGEMMTLEKKDSGKIEATDNKHDDCVISAAIALQVALQYSGSVFTEDSLRDKIYI